MPRTVSALRSFAVSTSAPPRTCCARRRCPVRAMSAGSARGQISHPGATRCREARVPPAGDQAGRGAGAVLASVGAVPPPHPAGSRDGRTLAFQHRAAAGWEIWTLALPADIARTGHLRLAQQVRGGADVDTAKLRSADTVRGTVEEATFKVRAAYGALVLPRAAVASILFGSGERGLARVVLANGDTVTGFLENEGIAIAAGGRTQRLAVEQREQLSLHD